jgi:hypothetical protein
MMLRETAALRDFEPAYDRYGSNATAGYAARRRGMFALLRKRTKA